MQANPSQRREREGERVQRAILSLVLEAHPESLSIPDLAREIDQSAVERAVGDLVAIGLLERRGEAVSASVALAHVHRLDLP